MSTTTIRIATLTAVAALGAGAVAADTHVSDFENGNGDGWNANAGSAIENSGGNPDGHIHTVFNDFGINYKNGTAPFVPDYPNLDSVTFDIDVKVESIGNFGLFNPRPWVLEIRDYDNPPNGYPWVSVFYEFTWLPGTGTPWETWSVTIDDTTTEEMPEGWGGTGDEDPDTFMPILPDGRTFANVLAGADELVYTTLLPGYFFTGSTFDIRLDNATVTTEGGTSIPGDLNGDGAVDAADLAALLAAWGPCDGCDADLDGNGTVDAADLAILLANWG